ncbi:MAG: PhnD/SsuA/transferrin family substrate-binding protein [Thermoanaerobaculia bacterium]
MTLKTARGGARAFLAGALALFCSGPASAADRVSTKPVHLAVGYTAQIFTEVDTEEARGITRVWAEQILKRNFRDGTSENFILKDVETAEREFLEKRVDLAALISDEYVQLRDRVAIQPIFVTANERGPYHQIVLLVRRDSGFRTLADLRNKRLALSKDQSRTIHLMWLETLLMKEGFRRAEDFFATVKEVRKPSQAILPVFFQQTDACLTTRQSFDVVKELNPQIERDLVVVAQSPDVAGGVLVFRSDYDPQARESVTEVLGTLDEDPQGNQLLRLFRMRRLIPWRPEYVASVEALLKEHERLLKSLERRK